jgi:CDP-diacylglycerol---serine O-phosphatidyltransferase
MANKTGRHIPSRADFVTFGNAIFGGVAISILTWRPHERTLAAVMLLVAAAFGCDLLDGMLARKYGSSAWGVGIDACADAISFGLAPSTAILSWSYGDPFGWPIAGLYGASVIIRLWRFTSAPPAKNFSGMPSPIGALLALSVVLVISPGWVAFVSLLCIAGLMVSTIQFPKLTGRWSIALLAAVWLIAMIGAGILAA